MSGAARPQSSAVEAGQARDGLRGTKGVHEGAWQSLWEMKVQQMHAAQFTLLLLCNALEGLNCWSWQDYCCL